MVKKASNEIVKIGEKVKRPYQVTVDYGTRDGLRLVLAVEFEEEGMQPVLLALDRIRKIHYIGEILYGMNDDLTAILEVQFVEGSEQEITHSWIKGFLEEKGVRYSSYVLPDRFIILDEADSCRFN